MGLERKDFIVIGADIGSVNYDKNNHDFYDKYSGQNEPGKLTFIIDSSKPGDYFVVGEVVAAATDYHEGFGFQEINPDENFESKSGRVREFVRKAFGAEIEPRLLVISHYY